MRACFSSHLVVIGCAEEDVVGGRVPLDEAHPAAVTLELLPRDCEVLEQTMRRDFPHFDLRTHAPKKQWLEVSSHDSLSFLQQKPARLRENLLVTTVNSFEMYF